MTGKYILPVSAFSFLPIDAAKIVLKGPRMGPFWCGYVPIMYFHAMKTPSIQQIRQELQGLSSKELMDYCLRLVKFKLENKELLSYLLFEANDQDEFRRTVKEEIDQLFLSINTSHMYFAKKTIRKVLRRINKFIRFSGNPETELSLRIYFCEKIIDLGITFQKYDVIRNIFSLQLKKIALASEQLHEDALYDYSRQIEELKDYLKS
jgi:hypothetical protein